LARTFLIAAGGTGGHLFPGIAVATELRRRDPDVRICFVGTARGLETRIVPAEGYPLELLPIKPLNRVGVLRLALGLLALPWAFVRAAVLLSRYRPACVFGVGGYAGGPLLLVAALAGIRTVILEPNARPGFTNRVLRPFVARAACGYGEARDYFGAKGVLTGTPIRGGFANLPARQRQVPVNLLVIGGSQGSAVLNRTLVEALSHLPQSDRIAIVHQTGERMHHEVERAYAQQSRAARIVPFVNDMERALADADLVISRSGATTCAELSAAGKASVLVPFARAADDHQRSNAKAMEASGASIMLEERDLSGSVLANTITDLIDAPERIGDMEIAARRLSRPDAASRVADLLEGAA
jgi:UDP-N-acetylglucosamine--N-acetylmuramyl-(pentapeptide) pyrophosphoryl-undecaprenol N-acetylglucosamine transferase